MTKVLKPADFTHDFWNRRPTGIEEERDHFAKLQRESQKRKRRQRWRRLWSALGLV